MIGKVQSSLSRGVPGADEIYVESMRGASFASRRTVVDAFADEPIEAVDRETAPRDASREYHGPRPHDVVAIEMNLARFRIEPSDIARDQNLAPQPPGLLQCTADECARRSSSINASVENSGMARMSSTVNMARVR